MSDRDRRDNARRKGKAAYWKGTPIDDNPFNASDTRRAWKEGYEHEWDESIKRRKALNNHVTQAPPVHRQIDAANDLIEGVSL